MKKKILVSLLIFTLFFLLGGIYIISTIETATSKLDTLITLHQVEILREHLLIQIKRVQSDLNLKNTRFARGMDRVITNVSNMELMTDTCFDCHHTIEIQTRLYDLKEDVVEYKKSISRIFTIRANTERLKAEEDRTFRLGERLITNVNSMISIASSKLEDKTRSSLKDISKTKNILFLLIALGPISIAIFAFLFIRGFTKPLNVLQNATKKIKEGDLRFKIEKLPDEFGEVASSFNEMTHALNISMLKVQESENRYRKLFESAGDAIFILEARGKNAGKIISANQAAADMHGYTVDELLKLNIIRDLDTHYTAEYAPDRLQRILRGEWIHEEASHRKKDGTVFPVEIRAGLMEFMGNQYILAFDNDITERKSAEDNLRESESRFKAIYENATDGILLADAETRSLYTGNDTICRMLGYSIEELKNIKIDDIHPAEELSAIKGTFDSQVKQKYTIAEDIPVLRKDGSLFYADISASPIILEGKKYLLGFFRDITERKKAEEMLIQSKLDWEDTFNNITDMITIHDRDFNIIRANRSAEGMLGLPLLNITKTKCFEYCHGKNSPIENCPSYESFMTKKPASFELYEPNLNKFLEIRVMPRLDQDGEVKGIIHVIRDITGQKRVQQELQRAEQLKAVGEWAAGLAHEIKNPLAGIKISAEVLSEDMDMSADGQNVIAGVIDEIQRIEILIKNLLDFAKPSRPQLTSVDINEIMGNSIAFSLEQPLSKKDDSKIIDVIKEFSDKIPQIVIDPHHLRQAFLNLLLNAMDSMQSGGTLTVKTLYNEDTGLIQTVISDTGRGIARENIESIFEPFYTTKSKGTGLGLAITKRLIEQYGGTISVESELSKGTVFTIYLPVKSDKG